MSLNLVSLPDFHRSVCSKPCPHWENILSFMSLLPLPPGLASPWVAVTQHASGQEEAPSMNELMNAQKPPCRAPADEKRRRACHSFPRCGLQYKQLFSCFVCMLCLPLILPHFSFRSCCPGIHFSSCAAYIWEVILWFILISLGFTCNSHLLCFQILTPF